MVARRSSEIVANGEYQKPGGFDVAHADSASVGARCDVTQIFTKRLNPGTNFPMVDP